MDTNSPDVPEGLWCAIPVYNNGRTVVAVAQACRALVPQVLVVDDGSTDVDVAGLFAGSDIAVIRHPARQGKGAALRTALAHIGARGGRWMITLDADGQHDASDLAAFFPLLREDPTTLVIGTRTLQGPGATGTVRLGRAVTNFWLLMETGLSLPDAASGFRAYPVSWISQLPLRTRHYDFELEVLVRAAWAGLPVRTVSVRARFPAPAERVSHFDHWLDNLRQARLHARLVLRRIAPLPIPRLIQAPQEPSLFKDPRAFGQRLLKSNASPAGLGVSAGLGVLLGALPIPGGHSVLILAVTLRLHLNPATALISQNLCMPPFVPVLCIQLGHYLLRREWLADITFQTWVAQAGTRLLEWGLGALVLGPLLGLITGYLTYGIVRALRSRPA